MTDAADAGRDIVTLIFGSRSSEQYGDCLLRAVEHALLFAEVCFEILMENQISHVRAVLADSYDSTCRFYLTRSDSILHYVIFHLRPFT